MKTALKILGLVALIVSCNSQNKKDDSVDQTVKMGKTVQDLAKQSQDLKKIAPVSEETLNSWFPETLQGMELQKIVKGTLTGYGISGATATYEGSDKNSLVVNINDGAGEKGMMLTSQYITFKNLNTDVETETKSEKILNNNTMLGVETIYKTEKKVLINFLYKDRFAVNMQADNIEKQVVWDAFKELEVDRLFK
ncbi:hypothetical protein GUA46_00520 [Muricauda sp. HICW]|uniref:Lipoprotein n=1 Tax=Flagellimonas chongwuensis TaxID=2697365 RepID=A0A850NI15_9FLAO|nr:hypothetical protein [Allomuricauda chongwuensis]NVN16807.1 hypothetical protein [Allomuricauda chongwuensis]